MIIQKNYENTKIMIPTTEQNIFSSVESLEGQKFNRETFIR